MIYMKRWIWVLIGIGLILISIIMGCSALKEYIDGLDINIKTSDSGISDDSTERTDIYADPTTDQVTYLESSAKLYGETNIRDV